MKKKKKEEELEFTIKDLYYCCCQVNANLSVNDARYVKVTAFTRKVVTAV